MISGAAEGLAGAGPAEPYTAGVSAEELPRYVMIDDIHAIRAMTHEVRMAALDELYATHRVYTATELAGLCGVSASAMSYHLRELEKHGFIRKVQHEGDRRSTYWQAVAVTLRVAGFDPQAQSENALVTAHIENMRKRVADEVRRRAETRGSQRSRLYPVISSSLLTLSQEQAEQFMERLYALLEEFTLLSAEDRGDEQTQRLHYFISAITEHKA